MLKINPASDVITFDVEIEGQAEPGHVDIRTMTHAEKCTWRRAVLKMHAAGENDSNAVAEQNEYIEAQLAKHIVALRDFGTLVWPNATDTHARLEMLVRFGQEFINAANKFLTSYGAGLSEEAQKN